MNNQISALGLFNLLPDSLENSEIFQAEIENQLFEEGNLYAHEVLRTVNISVKTLQSLTKSPRFKELMASEMSSKKEIYDGYEITESYRNIYDYSSCNDSRYDELSEKLEGLKNQIKARELFLKGIPEEGVVSPETGEVLEAPISKSSIVHTVKFKKAKKKEQDNNHLDNIFNK